MAVFRINVYDSEDNSYYSIVNNGIAGEDLLAGDLCYLNTDGKYWKANSSSINTSGTELRIAKEALLADEEGLFYVQGTIESSGLTVGVRYYVSTTDGEITTTKPEDSNIITRYIGTASATDALEFNPMDIASDDPIFNSDLADNLAMEDAVGSIDAGTTIADLQGMTFTEYIEFQNFPTVLAYISNASNLLLSGYSTSSLEVGTNYSFTAAMSFDTGAISNGDGSIAGVVSGNALTFNLENPDAVSYVNNSVILNADSTTTAVYTMVSGVNTWIFSGTNLASTTTYTDNKGGTDTVVNIESLKADTTPSNVTFNKTGYYPLFYGMSSSNTTIAGTGLYLNLDLTKQVASTGSRNISLNGTNEYIYFSYPASNGFLSSIIDGNGFDVTSSFTLYTVNVTSSGQDTEWTESYNIYRTTAVTTVSGQTFKFNF
jgi:hypothetical protein